MQFLSGRLKYAALLSGYELVKVLVLIH